LGGDANGTTDPTGLRPPTDEQLRADNALRAAGIDTHGLLGMIKAIVRGSEPHCTGGQGHSDDRLTVFSSDGRCVSSKPSRSWQLARATTSWHLASHGLRRDLALLVRAGPTKSDRSGRTHPWWNGGTTEH